MGSPGFEISCHLNSGSQLLTSPFVSVSTDRYIRWDLGIALAETKMSPSNYSSTQKTLERGELAATVDTCLGFFLNFMYGF